MKVRELKKGKETLIEKCRIADAFLTRFMGLMGKKKLSTDEAILFPKCNSIHTFFMRMPIDVIFVSKSGKVVAVLESLAPWRMLLPRAAAKHTIEMRAHRAKELGISPGDVLECEGVFS